MNYTFNLYTGHWVEHGNDSVKGAAFAAQVESGGGKKAQRYAWGADETYLTIWLRGVTEFIEEVNASVSNDFNAITAVTINVFACNPTVHKVTKKMQAIYCELRDIEDTDMRIRLLERKLLKKSYNKVATHDQQARLLLLMLSVNAKCTLNVNFIPMAQGNAQMRLAMQLASEYLKKANEECSNNVTRLFK